MVASPPAGAVASSRFPSRRPTASRPLSPFESTYRLGTLEAMYAESFQALVLDGFPKHRVTAPFWLRTLAVFQQFRHLHLPEDAFARYFLTYEGQLDFLEAVERGHDGVFRGDLERHLRDWVRHENFAGILRSRIVRGETWREPGPDRGYWARSDRESGS